MIITKHENINNPTVDIFPSNWYDRGDITFYSKEGLLW